MNLSEIKRRTGMVIPAWFPEALSCEEMEAVLMPCLTDVGPFANPDNVLVVVDGSPKVHQVARRVHKALGTFQVLFKEQNEGKGGAVATGLERLLLNPDVQFVVTRDHDNDHLANDVPNLVRLTAQLQQDTGSGNVVGIGRRASIHRHLGFVRGEYEWLMNEVIFESVKFTLALQSKAISTQYFAAYEFIPDMQTGFKCYTSESARLLVHALQGASQDFPGLDLRRHGAEIPVIVETLLRGGTIGEIMRVALENQPMTTFDLAGRMQVKGTVLAWTLRRCGIPLGVARQLFLNALARRLMSKEEKSLSDLLGLANWTLSKLAEHRDEPVDPIAQLQLSAYF